jgi:glycosyltransferase involved in cell wall biosynthesis
MTIRLLYLVTEDWYFVSHRLPLAIAAKMAGFDVTVATRLARHREIIEAAGLRALQFEMDRRGMSPIGLAQETLRLANLYRRERPDIVHHVSLRPVVVGGFAARLAGIRHVVSALTGMGFLFTDGGRGSLARRALQSVLPWLMARGVTIVQNKDDGGLLRSLGVPAERLRLIPGSGVDVTSFVPRLTPAAGKPVVMMASRLLWDKGVREFAEAARLCRNRGVQARFVLVGSPDPQNPSSIPGAELESWHASGILEWWGPREDMAAVFSQAHVVCLPSYREGLPKVLLEAAACGKPIITTDTPGCREIVRHGENGFLVPVRAVTELAEAAERLVSDATLREAMGRAGRRKIEEEFSLERVVSETLQVYAELLHL